MSLRSVIIKVIFNDQNIYQVYTASFHKPNAIDHFRCCAEQQSDHIFWNLEFGILEFVWNLFIGAWNFYNLN